MKTSGDDPRTDRSRAPFSGLMLGLVLIRGVPPHSLGIFILFFLSVPTRSWQFGLASVCQAEFVPKSTMASVSTTTTASSYDESETRSTLLDCLQLQHRTGALAHVR